MENRDRDRVSQRSTPTEAGRINREVEEEKGRSHNRGTSAEFGQSIGRSEDLSEGDNMRNKNDNDLKNTSMGNESSRHSGSDSSFGSQSGRSSSGSMGGSSSSSDQSSGRSGSRSNSSSDSSGIGDSSSGRH